MDTNNAAHWCKAVVEEVIKPLNSNSLLVPPPPVPPILSKAINASKNTVTTVPINPQYMMYYQQLYARQDLVSLNLLLVNAIV
jgi:hypothetical protein